MSLIKLFLLLVTVIIAESSFSQSDFIYNTWVAVGQSDCDERTVSKIKEPLKWSIQFDYDLTATITIRQITSRSIQNFSLEGNRIKTDYRDLLILEYKNDSLWLEEKIADKCTNYLLISKDLIQFNQKQKATFHNGDSIYFPEFGNSPELKNYADYEQYFHSNISRELGRVMGLVQINLSFVVTRTGELSNIKIVTNKDKYEKKILRILSQTENKWSPMYLNDEPVNSLVQIKFKYQYN